MRPTLAAILTAGLVTLPGALALGASAVMTDFEQSSGFSLANVDGQQGWVSLGNSPTKATVVVAPVGSPSFVGSRVLELSYGLTGNNGVIQGTVAGPYMDPVGETGSQTSVTLTPASAGNRYYASLWYRTPDTPVIAGATYGAPWGTAGSLFAIQPCSDINRQVWSMFFNTDNTVNGKVGVLMDDYWTDIVVATNLNWGAWYRILYDVQLIDGLKPDGTSNDIVQMSIYDVNGVLQGSAFGTSWEEGWKSGGWGGGTLPRALNTIDFRARSFVDNQFLGYVDNVAYSNPEPTSLVLAASAAILAFRRRR